MLMPDVNVFIYAHRLDVSEHQLHREWLERALRGPEHVGVSELVLASFLRIVTNHRIFKEPTSVEDALAFTHAIRSGRRAIAVVPRERHWTVFTDLCRTVGARANVVPDAYLAALAIDYGATWVTNDRGFARFPGLMWRPVRDDQA